MAAAKKRDRRLLTGAIIGVAGVGLLIGGGTFALWYDTEPISGANVSSGELHLELNGTGTWSNESGPIDISTYQIVPGEVLTLTQNVDITAEGDELTAEFTIDAGDVTGDPALLGALDITMTIPTPPAGISGTGPVYTVSGELGTATVGVQVQIAFPETQDGAAPAGDRSNWWNLVAQGEEINLASINFDLVQTTT